MSRPLVALNFKGTEVKGYRGKNMEVTRRWNTSKDFERRMGDLVNIRTEVQRQNTGSLYCILLQLDWRSDISIEECMERYKEAYGKVQRMKGTYGKGMVAKEIM